MPPASLSTFEVMMPGPMTARKRAMRRRQFLPREKKSRVRARRPSMKALRDERFMGGQEVEGLKLKVHRLGGKKSPHVGNAYTQTRNPRARGGKEKNGDASGKGLGLGSFGHPLPIAPGRQRLGWRQSDRLSSMREQEPQS